MISRLVRTVKLLNQTERNVYETLAISLFAVSFLSLFALWPSLKVITSYRKKVADAKRISVELTDKISNLEKAKQNLEIHREEIARVEKSMPREFNQGGFIRGLSFLAADNKVSILKTEFKIPEPTGRDRIVKVGVSLTVLGTTENIRNFLRGIETGDRYIKMESVLMRNVRDAATSNISAEIFFLRKDTL